MSLRTSGAEDLGSRTEGLEDFRIGLGDENKPLLLLLPKFSVPFLAPMFWPITTFLLHGKSLYTASLA